MRKLFILLTLLGLISTSFSQPSLTVTDAPNKVSVYDKYEVSFTLRSYDNPYDPEVINVYAYFTAPDGRTFRVIGFYYEGYNFKKESKVEVATRQRDGDCWKIRFTPDMPGQWTYVIHAVDQNGASSCEGLAFDCQTKVDTNGFIRAANNQFLKREVMANGMREERSFFPVGPNVAWYNVADYYKFKKPYGIYDYEYYIDALSGNANYMRIWSCRYQYLSLIGAEHTIRENDKPMMCFDSKLNQKDAAELDYIVNYAAEKGINLMLCLFSYGELTNESSALKESEKYGSMPSAWRYNPFHIILGLERPAEFFSDPMAMRVTRNLLRYYVARWGYATNIVCWELYNEVANIFKDYTLQGDEKDAVVNWHKEMANLIRSIDPHKHLVSTSIGNDSNLPGIIESIYEDLDIVQDHNYQNLQKAKSKDQMSRILFNKSNEMRELYPKKPCFMGEYGLSNNDSGITYSTKDPMGVDLHNSQWSSFFSGSMGSASFWFWNDLKQCDIFNRFRPMMVFANSLPVLSGTFTAATTGTVSGNNLVFPNNIETYYLVNTTQDTLIGWCQDGAFAYQALRRLTDQVGNNNHFANDGVFDPEGYVYTLDPAKRPTPSSFSNRIELPIANQRPRTVYVVRWFDPETGRELGSETAEAVVRRSWFQGKRIVIDFPASIRNIIGRRINNTYGDAVFMITKIPTTH